MITQIRGRLVEKNPTYVVVDCAGVGYLLHVSLQTFSSLPTDENIRLFTHLSIREDAHTLYGFITKTEREVFKLLISVSGVGPSIARTMLSSMSSEEVQNAIASENVALIQSVKGIGAKTAQRVIVDLKDKILKTFDIDEVSGPPNRDLEKASNGSKYSMEGTMKIPTMHSEGCASYEGTSREQIEEFATKLKLGLATNIDMADDKMKALSACQPNIEFLNNLVEHSYIGEDSFQTYCIDPYYNICFVDINALLNSEEGLDETFINMAMDFDEDGEDQTSNKIESPNILTNAANMNSTNTFIESYSLVNNAGSLSKKNGYKRMKESFNQFMHT